ncbi:MAG: kynureninase [Thermoleophilaceae bacterium]
MTDRAHAARLDAADPLASFRDRFVVDDPDVVYLDGNSLGRLPLATRDRLHALTDQWGAQLVSAWHEWIDLPERIGDLLATEVLGARPGEVIVSDSTTVNLFKLAAAVLDTREGAIVTDRANFPTDRYVLEGLAAAHGRELRLFDADPVGGPQPGDVSRACAGREIALVSLSQVAYRSGALADLEAIGGAIESPVLWDLSHSAGAVPIELERNGVELAVGCTYKYLNAGPGAPAFLYVREDLRPRLRTPIQGWFGQHEQFRMERAYDPDPGIRGFLAGTPPILALAGVEEGARLVAEAGVEALHAKATALTELIVELHDRWLAPLGFELASPRDPARRGAHVALSHPEAWPICRALIERAKVIPDFRGPDSIRLGVPPLYTRFVDVYDALERLRQLVERGEQRSFDAAPTRIT